MKEQKKQTRLAKKVKEDLKPLEECQTVKLALKNEEIGNYVTGLLVDTDRNKLSEKLCIEEEFIEKLLETPIKEYEEEFIKKLIEPRITQDEEECIEDKYYIDKTYYGEEYFLEEDYNSIMEDKVVSYNLDGYIIETYEGWKEFNSRYNFDIIYSDTGTYYKILDKEFEVESRNTLEAFIYYYSQNVIIVDNNNHQVYFKTYEELMQLCYEYKNIVTNQFIDYNNFIILDDIEKLNYRKCDNKKYKLLIIIYSNKKIVDDIVEKFYVNELGQILL
jgi:hypothetical protein